MLKPFWNRIFKEGWIFSLILFVILAGLRAYGILGGEKSDYTPAMISFLIMWSLPLIILTKNGRRQIGIKKPVNKQWVVLSPVLGAAAAFIIFLIGFLLYGHSGNNWYVTVGQTYFRDIPAGEAPVLKMFVFFTIPAMLFSPIGEEFFFRGIINETVRIKWNAKTGMIVNSILFGVVHLLHHGLYNTSGSIHILLGSGFIWVVLMFLTSCLFTIIREKTGSIWPAVIAHSAFSLTMNVTIFFIIYN